MRTETSAGRDFRLYKFRPEDFEGMQGIPEELADFYALHEKRAEHCCDESYWNLMNHWENLYFSIKHREVEGRLSPARAQDLRDYLEEILYG